MKAADARRITSEVLTANVLKDALDGLYQGIAGEAARGGTVFCFYDDQHEHLSTAQRIALLDVIAGDGFRVEYHAGRYWPYHSISWPLSDG